MKSMQNREMKSMAALAVSLCLSAAAYAATPGSASGSSQTGTSATSPGASGTSAQTGTAPATPGAPGAIVPGAGDTAAMSAKYTDGEIVAAVLAVDETEINAALAAEKEKMGKNAAKFAKMLLKQHRDDSTKVSKLAKKENIEISQTAAKAQELRSKGASDLAALSAKDSLEFEQGYIGAMVQGHTEVLALLDDHLIKDATNPKLKKQLADTRKHVAHHLEEAKRLQGDRASR
jgi:putative membrane protein